MTGAQEKTLRLAMPDDDSAVYLQVVVQSEELSVDHLAEGGWNNNPPGGRFHSVFERLTVGCEVQPRVWINVPLLKVDADDHSDHILHYGCGPGVQGLTGGCCERSGPADLTEVVFTDSGPAEASVLRATDMSLTVSASNQTTNEPLDSLPTAIAKNMMTVVLSLSIIFINGTLIHTFRQHQVLNSNPRYILYIHLVANDIILLNLIVLLLAITYITFTLNTSICMFMVTVAVLANLNNPLTLAAMALECYVAICFPLRHMQICTVNNTYVVIGLVWVISSLTILPDLFVVLATESLDFFHSGVFCVRDKIFRSPELKEKRDISLMVLLVLVWLILVYAYFNILCAAQGATSDARKARNTVLLHGFQLSLCMLTYTYSYITSGLIALLPQAITDILFIGNVLLHVLPRLVNPLVYGLRDKTFRKCVKRSLCGAGRDGAIQRKDEERPAGGHAR
ncbi:odorant receptor 131-2-like [Synchiropus splendidus]|uniref:odorant receptor 131-2-like n=1 Tax=Synchiropus splendidus TaxID=270530 RepID=UPI00237E7506|nr:odorant receptor 131-2-like [Synchiropus splendidus]